MFLFYVVFACDFVIKCIQFVCLELSFFCIFVFMLSIVYPQSSYWASSCLGMQGLYASIREYTRSDRYMEAIPAFTFAIHIAILLLISAFHKIVFSINNLILTFVLVFVATPICALQYLYPCLVRDF